MNSEEFSHILRTKFSYQSPRRSRFLSEKFPGWTTFIYYTLLLKIISASSIIALRGRYDHKKWADSSLDILRMAESVGGRFHISGLEGVAAHEGPLIFIANHMSTLDPLILPCITLAFNKVVFVVKESLLRYPIFGPVMRAVNPVTVTRQNPREDLKVVLKKGQEAISDGYSVVIFPQATRTLVFDPASFNSLGVKLARRAGVPVVPIALKTDFQGNGRMIREIGPIVPQKSVYLNFGNPMTVEGNGQSAHRKTVEFIIENLGKWAV